MIPGGTKTGKPPRVIRSLTILLLVFSLVAIGTGAGDFALGFGMLEASGARLGIAVADPLADSQLRFMGAIWAGWGVMLIWASCDVSARRTPLLILSGALLAGGIGRLIATHGHDTTPTLLWVLATIEIATPLFIMGLLFMAPGMGACALSTGDKS